MLTPLPTFQHLTARFPATRYQGSKAKLANWIWQQIASLDFATCLDAFGGTGAVAYRLKQEGKRVTYNDLLRFNSCQAKRRSYDWHCGQAAGRMRFAPHQSDLFARSEAVQY